jgi:putative membrane protein
MERALKKYFNIQNIALFIALLFHVSGLIGILFTTHKNWFINNTPLNLILMFFLLIITQQKKNTWYFIFMLIVCLAGFFVETIGVHTGYLFGNYSYGNVLGIQWKNVPLLIGVNWFIIIFCSGTVTIKIDEWVINKLGAEVVLSQRTQLASFVIDAALLTTFFDWVMEPVAVKLGFWQWHQAAVPNYNYACWFVISMLFLVCFRMFKFDKHNQFALHLFMIQLMFFLLLRTFL